jgi:hypothetical protein
MLPRVIPSVGSRTRARDPAGGTLEHPPCPGSDTLMGFSHFASAKRVRLCTEGRIERE